MNGKMMNKFVYLFIILFKEKQLIMNWKEHISSDSDILMGKPSIKGTRLSIEFLIGRLANGWTEQMLLDNYPRLTQQDLQAVLLTFRNVYVITYCMKLVFLKMPLNETSRQ